jgi:hypothetical protein
MKKSFKIAWKIYLILLTISSIAFWVYMINDDWIFVEEHGINLESIWNWFLWYFGYCYLTLTIYYWIPVSAGILIYKKLIRRDEKTSH